MTDNEIALRMLSNYRPASGQEICSWSYGAITRASPLASTSALKTSGTLDDEAIFGPRNDYCCSCRKYNGMKFKGTICDICGVPVTTTASRRTRFGHINLRDSINHNIGEPATVINSFPVLPAQYRESRFGQPLNALYLELLRPPTGISLQSVYDCLMQKLLAITLQLIGWDLNDSEVFIKSMALVRRESDTRSTD